MHRVELIENLEQTAAIILAYLAGHYHEGRCRQLLAEIIELADAELYDRDQKIDELRGQLHRAKHQLRLFGDS